MQRIDKIISASGAASRSEAETLIRRGAVTVNGVPVRSGSEKYDAGTAEIRVLGELLEYRTNRYLMMNKPAGYVSATEDTRECPVTELLDARLRRIDLFPVGRLDKDTEGLLLLTDDGDFAHRVISPKSVVEKLYYAETDGELNAEDVDAFAAGVILRDGTRCLPARLEILRQNAAHVTVCEGKYHQVKRMLASRGKLVTYLKRLSIGGLALDPSLDPGQYRELTQEELKLIFASES